MDHLMEQTSRMQPLPGFEKSILPGGRAWGKEQEHQRDGIPVSGAALASLAGLMRNFHEQYGRSIAVIQSWSIIDAERMVTTDGRAVSDFKR